MPFRGEYRGLYELETLGRLQDIYEFVWVTMADSGGPPATRDRIAKLIIDAHQAGMTPQTIKEAVLRELALPISAD